MTTGPKSVLALAGALAAMALDKYPGGKVIAADETPPPPAPPKPAQASYDAPQGGKRQGERIARQKLNYAASDKCLARIRERLAAKAR